MTTTTAWAVVDKEGEIILWTLKHNEQWCKNNFCKLTLQSWEHAIEYEIGGCIPVTIKPKEDGE